MLVTCVYKAHLINTTIQAVPIRLKNVVEHLKVLTQNRKRIITCIRVSQVSSIFFSQSAISSCSDSIGLHPPLKLDRPRDILIL